MSENLTPKELYEINHGKRLEEKRKKTENDRKPSGNRKRNIIIAVILLGIVIFAGKILLGTTNAKTLDEVLSVRSDDHIKGNIQAQATLVEYSDFQCPACKYFYPMVNELASTYGDKVKVVFRHFPLTQTHKNAQLAAQASEAAGKQGKFWEMHDTLFSSQADWSTSSNPKPIFTGFAEELGLNREQFQKDITSAEVKEKVKSNMKEGYGLGLQGTPSFFLNGKQIRNPKNVEELKSAVDAALQTGS